MGGRLAEALSASGHRVRCLVRDRRRAAKLIEKGFELQEGDVLRPETLEGAGRDIEVAYYLVHMMGRDGGGDFAEQEEHAARSFAQMARREGVDRVVYLGGLGDNPTSKHLRSRHRTARVLRDAGPPLTYFRAAMVVGAGSESYRTLRYLVERLPVMIAPSWLRTPTQPIGIDDVVSYLMQAPEVSESTGREVQIGGPTSFPMASCVDHMARVIGKRPRPKISVPLLTPWLSSLWLGLITPVDTGVARPLVEGLRTKTVVTDRSGADLFDVDPLTFDETLLRVFVEEQAGP